MMAVAVRAKAVLTERSDTLVALAAALLEHETLERADIERILATGGEGSESPRSEEAEARSGVLV